MTSTPLASREISWVMRYLFHEFRVSLMLILMPPSDCAILLKVSEWEGGDSIILLSLNRTILS